MQVAAKTVSIYAYYFCKNFISFSKLFLEITYFQSFFSNVSRSVIFQKNSWRSMFPFAGILLHKLSLHFNCLDNTDNIKKIVLLATDGAYYRKLFCAVSILVHSSRSIN